MATTDKAGNTYETAEETDAAYRKRRNLERLEGDEAMMTWMMFAMAAQAGGHPPATAVKHADAMISQTKARFV